MEAGLQLLLQRAQQDSPAASLALALQLVYAQSSGRVALGGAREAGGPCAARRLLDAPVCGHTVVEFVRQLRGALAPGEPKEALILACQMDIRVSGGSGHAVGERAIAKLHNLLLELLRSAITQMFQDTAFLLRLNRCLKALLELRHVGHSPLSLVMYVVYQQLSQLVALFTDQERPCPRRGAGPAAQDALCAGGPRQSKRAIRRLQYNDRLLRASKEVQKALASAVGSGVLSYDNFAFIAQYILANDRIPGVAQLRQRYKPSLAQDSFYESLLALQRDPLADAQLAHLWYIYLVSPGVLLQNVSLLVYGAQSSGGLGALLVALAGLSNYNTITIQSMVNTVL